MITAMPLLYGSYTVTRGPGTFTLEPPLDLNLAAGWPLFKDAARKNAETQYASYRERTAPKTTESVAGIAPTPPPPATNELIRVEPAAPLEGPKVAVVTFIARDREVLLVKRGVDPERGKWALPGGFVRAQ